jgi:transcriptional regulator with XRE-family HTH domain
MDDHTGFYSELGRRVRKAREERGLTQEALASLVSLTRTSVTNIEKGRQKILTHTLVDLAMALQTSCADLLPEQGVPDEKSIEQWLKGRSAKERAWAKSAMAPTRKER